MVPSCNVGKIVFTREQLNQKNLILTDVNCQNVTSVSDHCLGGSHFEFNCKPGYKFETNQEVFNAKCKYNKWERIPRCLPGDKRLIIIEKLDFSKS